MSVTQHFGLLLWRAGLLLAGSYSVFRVARIALAHMDWPPELEWGVGLAVTGAILVLASLIMERFDDARREEGLIE